MPKTTTKKKSAEGHSEKGPTVAERFAALEAKVKELEEKLTAGIARIEMIKSAVAEGRLDKL